ncbi:MAG TPA: dienelactone hydrolase family protein, partial [Chitinophagaceae bacterium]|nr:dienelactone hydrolase family protein [Chitinophagaceae bacterium]
MSIITGSIAISCNDGTSSTDTNTQTDSTSIAVVIKEDSVSYTLEGKNYKGYVVYDSNNKDKRPGVLVVHEWWGLNDYSRGRAKQLAELGYIAMAVDMFGDGQQGDDPGAAQALATPFYKDPTLSKTRLDAALNKLKEYQQLDTANVAAIGYCFGGFVVLNAAKLGADLKGVVSFHGGLGGVPVKKELVKAKILVCHGEADDFVNKEVEPFKKSMDSAGVAYTFKSYPKATHAFTNPNATEKGKKFNMPIEYNAAADSASWNDMKNFFKEIFGR